MLFANNIFWFLVSTGFIYSGTSPIFFLPNQEDTMEESGWKNVHGDVFRPPQYPMILSSLLGSGIQLFCMVLIVICEGPRYY